MNHTPTPATPTGPVARTQWFNAQIHVDGVSATSHTPLRLNRCWGCLNDLSGSIDFCIDRRCGPDGACGVTRIWIQNDQ